MSFRLPPTSPPQPPDAPPAVPQDEPSRRPAAVVHGPAGRSQPGSSTGRSSLLPRSPLGALARLAAHVNPRRERSVHEFPARQLEVVLRECQMLSRHLFADPPPSIERLSAEERSQLEDILARRFVRGPHNPDPEQPSGQARQAVRAWVQVQSARLRRTVGDANASPLRPEYADALNNFLQILHPSVPLHPGLRQHLVIAFNHQRTEGRISPPIEAMVDAEGIEALAGQGYRLDGRTGAFQPPPQPLAPAVEPWLEHVQRLSSTPRSRIGKLPDSEQYRYIKSMTRDDRTFLEANLEARFMDRTDPPSQETAQGALTAWLTLQQVRLRVHSADSIQRHAQALRSPAVALRMAAAALGTTRSPGEFSRFHSEHESSDRPEYAAALNSFLRLLQPSTMLPDDLRQRVAERLTYHAEVEGTLSAPIVEALQQHGLDALVTAQWRLDPANNVFSARPVTILAPNEFMYLATPAPLTPARPTEPLSHSTPASSPAPH